MKANAAGESQEVKVKVRVDHNGMAFIASATLTEKVEKREAEENGDDEANGGGNQMDCDEVSQVYF